MLRLLRDIREDLTPLLHEKQSNMLVDGMLSPEEFVAAGDRLCEASPIWGWAQGDVDKRKGYLPPNKQFLVVRGLASNGSVHGDGEWRVEMDEWCDAALGTGDQQEHDMVFIDYTYTPEKSSASSAAGAGVGAGARDVRTAHKTQDADNRVDSHVVVGADVLDGPIPPNGNGPSTASGTSATGQQQQQQQTLHAARLYDLSVSYDRYYRVPRFWMRGYDAVTGLPLEPREVLTDFIKDQALSGSTVSVEVHPHEARDVAVSVHPCQHASAMVAILRQLGVGECREAGGGTFKREDYLSLFLKMIQSMVDITYDFSST